MERRTRQQTAEPPEARVGRWSRWRHLPALAFGAVIAIGALANLANPALLRPPDATFWDGAWAEQYQGEFDASSPLLATSRVAWGVIDLAIFGQGRPGVLVGSDGWLYSTEEFDVVDDAQAATSAWVDTIEAVAERLATDDIELVVALVPSKAAMVPESSPAPLPLAAEKRYDEALRELRRRGIVAPDLRRAMAGAGPEPVFLRTDTHWTPNGAAAAARAIARAVAERTTFSGYGSGVYVTEIVGTEPLLGDLTAFLDLGPFAESLGPPPDSLEVRRTVSLEGPGADLFADVTLPVALVGTSYSADPRWNMAGALRHALGVDIHEAAASGVGPLEPLERYLGSEAFANTRPEVVVWEIPERYLTLEGFVPWDGS